MSDSPRQDRCKTIESDIRGIDNSAVQDRSHRIRLDFRRISQRFNCLTPTGSCNQDVLIKKPVERGRQLIV